MGAGRLNLLASRYCLTIPEPAETRSFDEHLPIMMRPMKATLFGKDGRHCFERHQVPVLLAWVIIVHRMQDLAEAVVGTRDVLMLNIIA